MARKKVAGKSDGQGMSKHPAPSRGHSDSYTIIHGKQVLGKGPCFLTPLPLVASMSLSLHTVDLGFIVFPSLVFFSWESYVCSL